MFGLFSKDPIKKLNDRYQILLEKAMNAQRNGDIALYAELSADADKIFKEIEKLENEKLSKGK